MGTEHTLPTLPAIGEADGGYIGELAKILALAHTSLVLMPNGEESLLPVRISPCVRIGGSQKHPHVRHLLPEVPGPGT